MSLKSAYIREQKRYTQGELVKLFVGDESEIIRILKRLKEYGVLKVVKASDEQKTLTDLIEEDIEVADVEAGENEYLYIFTFVGVITVAGRIIKCYPKYLLHTEEPVSEMKQIIKVIEKYNGKEQIIRMVNDTTDSAAFNMLAVMLWMLQDYFENGSYSSLQDIIEINGTGEILWDKTINETFAIINDNRPYYQDMYTRKRVNDDQDYFKRLHECVLTKCSKELASADLLNLFDILGVDLSDEEICDFGETDYILDRIYKELNIQFGTRKQMVLKTIYSYIATSSTHIDDMDCFSMFGTNSFNLIWEKACSEILDNQLDRPIGLIALPVPLGDEFNQRTKLIDVIEHPIWFGKSEREYFEQKAQDTLIPDIISIYKENDKHKCIIFDAKYYNLQLEKNKPLRGQPGIESVTKQYLYQLAYKDFLDYHGMKQENINNCFLMPTEGDEIIETGYVMVGFLKRMGLGDISIRLLPARTVYQMYLENKKMEIAKLNL